MYQPDHAWPDIFMWQPARWLQLAASPETARTRLRLLKPDGIYISSELGPLAQNPFLALIAPLHGGKKVMFPIPKHDQLMVRYVKELIESGQFKPVIDRTYPSDQIVEAYRYVETGQKTGNVVISLERSH
jgi:NADPH:quinone reductase-like Zn-dependent oxidoreductase